MTVGRKANDYIQGLEKYLKQKVPLHHYHHGVSVFVAGGLPKATWISRATGRIQRRAAGRLS